MPSERSVPKDISGPTYERTDKFAALNRFDPTPERMRPNLGFTQNSAMQSSSTT